MFTGKLSFTKNIIFLIILALHAFFYVWFLNYSWFNSLLFIISIISFISLICLALISFLDSKSHFVHFFIGIIISSIPIIFVVNISSILIVPEVIFLSILFVQGIDRSEAFLKTRVKKTANLVQHDPAVTHMYAPTPLNLAFKMDIAWNPDSTVHISNDKELLERKTFSLKIQLTSFILSFLYLACSIIVVNNYYNFTY